MATRAIPFRFSISKKMPFVWDLLQDKPDPDAYIMRLIQLGAMVEMGIVVLPKPASGAIEQAVTAQSAPAVAHKATARETQPDEMMAIQVSRFTTDR